MEKDLGRHSDLLRPTIEQAETAVRTLASFYGYPNNNVPMDSSLTLQGGEKKLLQLASDITNGIVHSHSQVAEALWKFGPWINCVKRTPSAAFDFALYGVYIAALKKQKSFSE
ncbi:MAG: hypothetical protein Q7R31_00380 [Candidatus Levybacteria bacterium]|nr:hypothetical protein [Candidatus Levybacteria bacterium]